MVSQIAENIQKIRERIQEAARRAGRSAQDIKLVAVTKKHPLEDMIEAVRCKVDAIGENQVQEAREKRQHWPSEFDTPWHMIGHLQRNKVRKALEIFDCIQSIDTLELAFAVNRVLLEKGRQNYPVLIEVNVSGEPTKSGVSPEGAFYLVEQALSSCPLLKIEGLMTVGPLTNETFLVRSAFRRLVKLKEELQRDLKWELPVLSMGMSDDFEIAIEEGSTMVRIGSAIFGPRSY